MLQIRDSLLSDAPSSWSQSNQSTSPSAIRQDRTGFWAVLWARLIARHSKPWAENWQATCHSVNEVACQATQRPATTLPKRNRCKNATILRIIPEKIQQRLFPSRYPAEFTYASGYVKNCTFATKAYMLQVCDFFARLTLHRTGYNPLPSTGEAEGRRHGVSVGQQQCDGKQELASWQGVSDREVSWRWAGGSAKFKAKI